jgi:hypothetical protein
MTECLVRVIATFLTARSGGQPREYFQLSNQRGSYVPAIAGAWCGPAAAVTSRAGSEGVAKTERETAMNRGCGTALVNAVSGMQPAVTASEFTL